MSEQRREPTSRRLGVVASNLRNRTKSSGLSVAVGVLLLTSRLSPLQAAQTELSTYLETCAEGNVGNPSCGRAKFSLDGDLIEASGTTGDVTYSMAAGSTFNKLTARASGSTSGIKPWGSVGATARAVDTITISNEALNGSTATLYFAIRLGATRQNTNFENGNFAFVTSASDKFIRIARPYEYPSPQPRQVARVDSSRVKDPPAANNNRTASCLRAQEPLESMPLGVAVTHSDPWAQ